MLEKLESFWSGWVNFRKTCGLFLVPVCLNAEEHKSLFDCVRV